ncbi:helix-turn-helix domain-containing protein [Halomonas sp. HMF6819]|uniref:helix-turn-helix domain-containing protein n=1 Tax=Halomonas sp. HMF6819 TaxID=3373085 RepID=UPI0037B0ED98
MRDVILPDSAARLNFYPRSPSAGLSPWVQCLWRLERKPGFAGSEKLYPDAGASLTITLDPLNPTITLCVNRHTLFETWDTPARKLGVRFRPAGAYALLGLSPSRFTDTHYLLDGSERSPPWQASLSRVAERLYRLTPDEGLALLDAWLCQRLTTLTAPSRTPQLVEALSRLSCSPLEAGARLGLSRRTLERRLEREAGVSPGQLMAFARLHYARRALIGSRQPLAQIALTCGYHDQSHFSHAFKRFALEAPGAYRQRKLSQIYKA